MPTCRTCRGEYPRETENRPTSYCLRCGSDVTAWEENEITLPSFLVDGGGFLGILPLLGALLAAFFVALYWWMPGRDYIHHFLASGAALFLSTAAFFGLFTARYRIREREWASQICVVAGPSSALIIAFSFVVGISSAVAAFTLGKLVEYETLRLTFSIKLFFAGFYGLAFGGFSAGLTLAMLMVYLRKLDRVVPQPVFMHTDRMVDIVLRTASVSLRDREEPNFDDHSGDGTHRHFEPLKVLRDQNDGGIDIWFREYRYVRQADGAIRLEPQTIVWVVDADKWGRVRSLVTKVPAPYPPPRTVTIIGRRR